MKKKHDVNYSEDFFKKINVWGGVYCNKKEFYEELKEFLVSRSADPDFPIPEKIIVKLYRIIINLSHNRKFLNYTFKDQMVSEAIYTCIKYIDKFKPEKSDNPFGYFTQVASNAFIKIIKIEKENSNIKQKLYDMHDTINLPNSKTKSHKNDKE